MEGIGGWTGRQADTQTDRKADIQTDTDRHRQTDKRQKTGGHTEGRKSTVHQE